MIDCNTLIFAKLSLDLSLFFHVLRGVKKVIFELQNFLNFPFHLVGNK
jgi:hypothetical protein